MSKLEKERLLSKEYDGSGGSIEHDEKWSLPSIQYACRSKWALVHIATLIIYTAVFIISVAWKHSSVSKVEDNLLLRPAFRYRRQVVDYNFKTDTAFKGPPMEEVDKQWLNLLNKPHELRLSEYDVSRANISTVQLADGTGDYIVQPQAYHLLHCLFNLYKYAHTDFYGEDPKGPEWIATHTDHCIDNLRLFVQCHVGGSGLTTYRWAPGWKLPAPVLAAEETCIDWDFFDQWVRRHSLPVEDIVNMEEKHLLEHPIMGVVAYKDFAIAGA